MAKLTREHVQKLKELLYEMPMNQEYVNTYAKEAIEWFELHYGLIRNDEVRSELFCAYQNEAWNKLFWAIGTPKYKGED
jgi:hypothetical protein